MTRARDGSTPIRSTTSSRVRRLLQMTTRAARSAAVPPRDRGDASAPTLRPPRERAGGRRAHRPHAGSGPSWRRRSRQLPPLTIACAPDGAQPPPDALPGPRQQRAAEQMPVERPPYAVHRDGRQRGEIGPGAMRDEMHFVARRPDSRASAWFAASIPPSGVQIAGDDQPGHLVDARAIGHRAVQHALEKPELHADGRAERHEGEHQPDRPDVGGDDDRRPADGPPDPRATGSSFRSPSSVTISTSP